MAISHVSGSDTGAQARAKINAAIDKANLVDDKAAQSTLASEITNRQNGDATNATAIAAEATARQDGDTTNATAIAAETQNRMTAVSNEASARSQADTALTQALAQEISNREAALIAAMSGEATARASADAQRPTFVQTALPANRPGELSRLFTSDTAGTEAAAGPVDGGSEVTASDGRAYRITGAGKIATLSTFRVEPQHVYRARFVFRRRTNTDDPANDAVRLALAWLKSDKSALANVILADILDVTVNSGRLEYFYNFAVTDFDTIDVRAPSGTVYVRPFLQAFGGGALDVEVVEIVDLTNAIDFSPDVSGFRRELAGFDARLESFTDRMDQAEDHIEESHEAEWLTRGTLDDDRLSTNVMLRGLAQTVTAAKTFTAPLKMQSDLLIGDEEATGGAATAKIVGNGDFLAIMPTNAAGGYDATRQLAINAGGKWTVGGGLETDGHLDVGGNISADGTLNAGNKSGTRANLQVYSTSEVNSIAAGIVGGAPADLDTLDELAAAIDDDADFAVTIRGEIAAVVDGAPADLNTLNKLAAAIDDDADFATTIRAEINGIVAAQDAMVFKGVIDASSNPNYPAADRGWTYRVSVAGKVGGASGKVVEVGDIVICLTDGTVTGNEAAVGANWSVIQTNIDGALVTTDIGVTVQAYDADLAAIALLTTTVFGRAALTDNDEAAFKARVNLEIGVDVQAHDATLDALASFSTNGFMVQTAADTFTARQVAGTANQISVTNGDGVAGDPTVGLSSTLLIPGTITVPNAGLHLLDTNASHSVIVKPGSDLTADRTLTVTTGDADRTLNISATNVTVTVAGAAIIDDATQIAVRKTIGIDRQVGTGTINDDEVGTINFGGTVTGGIVEIYTNSSASGAATFHYRSSSTPFCTKMSSVGGPWTASTATLTGTTGVDGDITVSADATGIITIENRSGSARAFFARSAQQSRD